MNLEAVGGFLRGYRKERGLKAEDLAQVVGEDLGRTVGRATIYRIEAGDHSSGFDIFLGIVSALKVAGGKLQQVATSNMTSKEGEQVGRKMARGDATYLTEESAELLRRLTPEQRQEALNRLRQMLQENQ